MAVETSDKPNLPHDFDDDDDAPIIYKRLSAKKNQSLPEAPNLPHDFDDDDDAPIIYKRLSAKKNQSLSEARKSSSHIHEGQSYRQIPNASSSNGQTSSMQKGNTAPSLKPSAMKPSVGISRAPNSVGNTSSVKFPVANSKSPSLADKQKMFIDVKVEPKSTVHSGKDFCEDSEDDEDNKPLSFRLKNSNHDNKVTSVVKKSYEDSDGDDDVPLSKKLPRNFNLGTSSSNHDDSDKKPISKIQKERQNGSGMSNKQDRPSLLPAKRPLDNSNSLHPSVKKPKVSGSDASIKTKPGFQKRELKLEDDDDDDDIPISQRIKKQTVSGDKSSSMKKVITKVAKVNKSSSKSFKKQTKKPVKKSGSGSEYSKSSKLLPSSGDGQKKWTTLVHNGVIFPPPYQRHGVKMLYKGRPVDLTPEQEEVGFYL